MKGMSLAAGIGTAAAVIALAAPAQADDYDYVFKQTINRLGVYGPQDQLAREKPGRTLSLVGGYQGFRPAITIPLMSTIPP